jgi:hypothetical protein
MIIQKNKKQFMCDILPILDEINFDEIKNTYSDKIEKEICINGLCYWLVIGLFEEFIEIGVFRNKSVSLNFSINSFSNVFESSWVYLTYDCSPKWYPSRNSRFGINGKYYMSDYKFKNIQNIFCIYCDSFICSSLKNHLLKSKHVQNVKKYIIMLENILQLNNDVIKYIYSFL